MDEGARAAAGTLATPSRYVVGIDLGTTNSAVAYVDSAEAPWRVRTFAVPQVVAAGQVEARETLPSFHYQPATGELPAGALKLPWNRQEPTHAVGFFARDHGALVPGRLIGSAKSWLCHSGVDRTAELLPWHGAPDVEKLSPVEASSRYLAHIRAAWDAQFREHPLAAQEIVLTLPASFDEVARELTIDAAKRAGLSRVVLIEEPQAAFYAWINNHAESWDQHVSPGQKILVCDIGGGTSDFTLIRVRRGESGKVQFHRVAVGEHLILGGDNLDLALAHHLERKLKGDEKLSPRQWDVLVRVCRQAKETLLGDKPPESMMLNLPGSGSKLIGGGLQVEVRRDEVQRVLVEGFFPQVALDARPTSLRSGFQEFGLPYAPDAAVTRYLAAFLTAHRNVALEETEHSKAGHDTARPDIVLFNGGMFESPEIRTRLLEVLASWFPAAKGPAWKPMVMDNDRLDLAVARGAAYYGMVRRGQGVRIAAELARTYYIGVDRGDAAEASVVCLVPANAEPGRDINLVEPAFNLLVSAPVEFPLYVSSTRLTDPPGAVVPVDREQMTPLSPIRTVLKTSKKEAGEEGTVPVNLHARLSEIGTVDLWCSQRSGGRTWRLVFDVRSATETDRTAHEGAGEREGFLDEETWQKCRAILDGVFSPAGSEKPDGLMKRLAEALGTGRDEWPTSLLRRLWETLIELEPGRRRSASHEARWANLLGFSLRPGYGLALDDWRVAETWRLLFGKLIHPSAVCQTEWWILWRRIAGGLAGGQQRALADPLLAPIRALYRRLTNKGKGEYSFGPQESVEIWRLLGSLELLPAATKIELGQMLVELLNKKKMEAVWPAMTWALGRIAARRPVYGPLNGVVPVDLAAEWLAAGLRTFPTDPASHLAVMQMARRTGDRHRDLPEKLRSEVLAWLAREKAASHLADLVREVGELDREEQGKVFGESLPKGLRIL